MQNAEKISITITADMMKVIRDSVAAGEYATTSEAVRDAVRLWQRQRTEDAERLEAIRARVQRSFDDPRSNLTGEQVRKNLDALYARYQRD